MSAIKFENVSFKYNDDTPILENCNFDFDYGKFILLSGYSGQGKSTFMNLCFANASYDKKHFSGNIYIDNKDITKLNRLEISNLISVVLQNADLQIINKVVKDEIAFGTENLAFKNEDITKIIENLTALFELDKEDKTRELSGGQKQKLITASSLAMGNKILILDEPLANLDYESSLNLLKILKELSKRNYLVILIEHRLDLIVKFVDEVYKLDNKVISKVENIDEYLQLFSKSIVENKSEFVEESPLFEANHLKFKYKEKEILKDISFKIYKGGRYLFIGENGCGKTTLLKILARLLKDKTNSITQHIDPILDKKRKQRIWFKKVGYVFQNPDYQLFMPTVKKELEYSCYSKEYAEEIAKKLDVYHLYSRHPHSLSEGQKRRVSIAAILASKPEVLILDEPTVGQDYNNLRNLVSVLNEINEKENTTIITITHDKRCAKALADKVFLIEDGVITKTGEDEVIDSFLK